jgi:hypothetical protein
MITERLACALALPTRDAVCPVYTSPLVEVPPLEVSVTVAVKLPEPAYTWLVVGVAVVTCGLPSPKSHLYEAIVPNRTVEDDASNAVG